MNTNRNNGVFSATRRKSSGPVLLSSSDSPFFLSAFVFSFDCSTADLRFFFFTSDNSSAGSGVG